MNTTFRSWCSWECDVEGGWLADNAQLHACIRRPPRAHSSFARTPHPPPLHRPTQPGKCLYTTIRELVENSLDAAEAISQLPDIDIKMWVSLCSPHPAASCAALRTTAA